MDRVYLQTYLHKYPFPEQAIQSLLKGFDDIKADEYLRNVIDYWINAYENKQLQTLNELIAAYADVKRAAKKAVMPCQTVEMIYFLLCTKQLKETYTENSIELSYYDAFALDLISKAQECYDVDGVWGSSVDDWFVPFFALMRVAIGRLQFEITYMPNCCSVDGTYVFGGQRAINIHIPSGSPLDIAKVRQSMKEAVRFYGHYFEEDRVLFTCRSWLLYPGHYQMLPSNSRIRQFMDEFTLITVEIDPVGKDLWRIFKTRNVQNIDELPVDTNLQRSYAEWLKQGKPIGVARGICYLPKGI